MSRQPAWRRKAKNAVRQWARNRETRTALRAVLEEPSPDGAYRKARSAFDEILFLTPDAQAVRDAVLQTLRRPDGLQRLRLFCALWWGGKPLSLDGAALACYVSRSTAGRWTGEFLRLVKRNFREN